MHNMAADVPISNHVTRRNGVYQYVRRVPEDVRCAFDFARVQKSLGTRNERIAREKAVALDRDWDHRFALEREKLGAAPIAPGEDRPTLSTANWAWADWEALARWLELTLAEEDWRARCASAPGRLFGPSADPRDIPWRDNAIAREHIDRRRLLEALTSAGYAEERLGFLQRYVARLGVSLDRSSPYYERFLAACHAAELAFLDLFLLREARKGGIGNPHPDTVKGPWRSERPAAATEFSASNPLHVEARQGIGKSMEDCVQKWIQRRRVAKKSVRASYLAEMRSSVAAFSALTGVDDAGLITRRDVIRYRDHLESSAKFAAATINKKVGFITTLIDTAVHASWLDRGIGTDIFLPLPEDENSREPYSGDQLARIFKHAVFTNGYRFDRTKACGELQFWLPLIACCHGMISSEILQLGPATIQPHEAHKDVLCFVVTNAGGRSVKTFARKRWVPIRKELFDLGLSDLVRRAEASGQTFLWSAMNELGADLTRISGYFSSFWADISAKEFGIAEDGVSLYSFRHAFQDMLGEAGYGEDVKKALMGHSDSGMTGRYGTKKKPKPVPILTLNEAIQCLDWPFLGGVQCWGTG
ncbi:DUF6538 domain-containing protein [Salinarimonas rosea]|uniref:DUF6538 domain-containing protein n=1 Tax=Salinarimonas rosea TaxID=552063 RepID=UPI00049172FF|nr:DUF6538 domain-containing protein [Salinarimonas rosea]